MANFTNSETSCEGFESTWKKSRDMREGYSQTSEVLTDEQETQSQSKIDSGLQTDVSNELEVRLDAPDTPELAEFLAKLELLVYKELEQNARSRAFDGYSADWTECDANISCRHSLCQQGMLNESHVTAVNYNSTGSVVAVAYGRQDHADWCAHRGVVATWNTERGGMKSGRADNALELASCVTSVAFHPELPGRLAAGCYAGEVVVWDVGEGSEYRGDPQGASHREPVTGVVWLREQRGRKLLSASSDGKLIQWNLNLRKRRLDAETVFLVPARPGAQVRGRPGDLVASSQRSGSESGVTAIAFSSEDPTQFVVGTESGSVFKCSIEATVPAVSNLPDGGDFISPVTLSYEPHRGPVYGADWSGFHRNAVLTCSTDGSVRLYNSLQIAPVLVVEPGAGYLYGVRWSPTRPLVVAIATGDGRLLLYDLLANRIAPSETLEVSESGRPVYCVVYNPRSRSSVATGDAHGIAKIWRLGEELVGQQPKEFEVLAKMVNIGGTE